MVCIWKFNQKDKLGWAGSGAREHFRWLHLPEAGVYKNSSEFIENSSYFLPSWW